MNENNHQTPALRVERCTKQFGSNTAVSGVTLGVSQGQIYALIGPNGSGKTTLIKTTVGLLQPTEGSIAVKGIDVVKDPVRAKALIGYVPDEPAVWPSVTGEEFLRFTGTLFGMGEAACSKRMGELLPAFEFSGIERGYFEDYSRGNKQKFAILAALMHDPAVLLVDEPIVGLDPTSAETAKKLFVDFARRGGSVLLATHTLPVAEEIADRIGVLSEGKLVAEGTMAELKSGAKLAANASLGGVYQAYTRT